MMHNLEDKNRKELLEIAKIGMLEYQKLLKENTELKLLLSTEIENASGQREMKIKARNQRDALLLKYNKLKKDNSDLGWELSIKNGGTHGCY